MTDKYNFDNYAAILKAIDALPDRNKKEYDVQMDEIEEAAKSFLKTRTNSDLLNMANETVTIEKSEFSLWDYVGSFCDWYQEERDRRNWPIESEVQKLLEEWGEDYATDDDTPRQRFFVLEKQVAGIQKKVDKLVKLLEGSKVTLSVEEALRL